jgi:hypothetical protein
MARRMYDLDNGTENIKVKEIVANKITAVTSAITTEYDALQVNGGLSVGLGAHTLSATGGATFGTYVRFPVHSTVNRPILTGQIGAVIYDATLSKLIIWNGTAWINVDGTSLGE